MRFDKPIDKVDSIVGIPIFSTKNENRNIHNTDQKQEYIASNDATEQKIKKSKYWSETIKVMIVR